MHEYVIEGGYPIHGTVTASGNKNAALPCIAATLMTEEPVILHNIPEIQDTNVMFEILKSLGAKVEKLRKLFEDYNIKIQTDPHLFIIDCDSLDLALRYLEPEFFNTAMQALSVVCCRCSPTQKRLIVKTIKKNYK